ncbi:PTS system, cellobiose-specific IIC component [Pilibacter termitis]|uniref:Permease IIC component n=1 Tax=Pilibacter termitis TaxID=263852 RepID=A0A1T4MZ86_9ENTE|nr:PTS transporter subunit EIIC [Pilibacter termitis]SJZ72211.1 PTS system, cellobiose-specific IIC component [Pilibacter termitis]
MNKLEGFINEKLVPVSQKVQNNKYMSAVSDGFTAILPVTIIGAILTLLSVIQFEPYQNFLAMTKLGTLFGYAGKVTTDLLGVYVAASIAFVMTQKLGHEQERFFASISALVMFFLLLPTGASEKLENGDIVTVKSAISMEFLGAKGMFMGIILGILVPIIYCWFINRNITIKLPAGVPPMVSKSFASIIPVASLVLIFSIVRLIFEQTSFNNANNFIYTILGEPLMKLGNNPVAFLILILVCQILWFFGIHGHLVIRPILQAVFTPLSLMNLQAFEQGQELPNMITYQHIGTYTSLGGSGALLGFAILMAFTAKSKRYKMLGKMALPSTFFGINEPVIFGIPLVLNTMFMIPFLLGPLLMFIIPYVLQTLHIIETLRGVTLTLGVPALAYGWIEGGLPILIMQIILIAVQVIVWLPFFKVADARALAEEGEAA